MSQEIERRETSLQQQMQWSKLAATGDIVPDAYRNKPANVLVAIGFGAMFCSWMNDSGFWVVSRLSGMTEKETLRTWSLQLTADSIIGLVVTLSLSKLLPFV